MLLCNTMSWGILTITKSLGVHTTKSHASLLIQKAVLALDHSKGGSPSACKFSPHKILESL